MPSYAHKKLLEYILKIDTPPEAADAFQAWIEAGQHLKFLAANAQADEVVVYAGGPFSYIYSVVVPNERLVPFDRDGLLQWSCTVDTHAASYVYGGGRDDMWIDRGSSASGCEALKHARTLVHLRTFEGWSGKERSYLELNQEYAHLAGIHWRPEHGAYCCFDHNGDIDHVVSTSMRADQDVTLATFTWPKLEEYLTVSKSSLVRMFDFTLLKRGDFSGWNGGEETVHQPTPEFACRQKIAGAAAYTRGFQIIRPRQPAAQVFQQIKDGWTGHRSKSFVEFTAFDFRHKSIAIISTDPKATTNYFDAKNNDLPFELSPAFFRPEVLSKYKTDRDKYKISDRGIECRGAWGLRGYDVNDAGQVHAYICDLRDLPYSEQLHWASFNEPMKETISERAYINDFKGHFVTFMHPREEIIGAMSQWNRTAVRWWKLRDEGLLHRANPPLTTSRDEWANAFMDLSQLIAEGFEVKEIRIALQEKSIAFDQKDQSIVLLEKLIAGRTGAPVRLAGLRAMQQIRSKVKGHAGSSDGQQLADDALAQHGSFGEHFKHICSQIVDELEMIEQEFA